MDRLAGFLLSSPVHLSMKHTLFLFITLLLASLAALRADPVKLEPNAQVTLEFPELPVTYFEQKTGTKTTPILSAQLPENFTADKTFPLFVYINGGNGGTGGNASFARRIIGPRDFIAVNLPLFKEANAKPPTVAGLPINLGDLVNSNDAAVLGSSYRVMLEKLAQTIPNIAVEHSTLGGFSNGAHATSVLIAAKDEFILSHFSAFVLLEGGIGLVLKPDALQEAALKGHRILMLFGDQDKDPTQQAQRTLFVGPLTGALERQAKTAQLDFTHLTMHGHGHEEPPEYLKLIGAWARGEALPEVK
jgi:predicted esterase